MLLNETHFSTHGNRTPGSVRFSVQRTLARGNFEPLYRQPTTSTTHFSSFSFFFASHTLSPVRRSSTSATTRFLEALLDGRAPSNAPVELVTTLSRPLLPAFLLSLLPSRRPSAGLACFFSTDSYIQQLPLAAFVFPTTASSPVHTPPTTSSSPDHSRPSARQSRRPLSQLYLPP
jgi:hypothetical protein